MEKNKIHKLDLIFIIGIGVIAIISALIDVFYSKVFPVFSCASVYYVCFQNLVSQKGVWRRQKKWET